MKRKIFNVLLAFVCAFSCVFGLVACDKKDNEIKYNISINMPNRVHVEYNSNIFVKDGNEYYLMGENIHGSHRGEIYMKRELSSPVYVNEYGGWDFVTARYDYSTSSWILASDDNQYYDPWITNDRNQNTYTNTEYILRTGYSDINMSYEMSAVTITKLEDDVVTIAGSDVECIVWEYVYEEGTLYNKEKFWFAKDTNIFIKESEIFDKADDIDDPENIRKIATYYKVGESMDEALEIVSSHIGESRTKYVFLSQYR